MAIVVPSERPYDAAPVGNSSSGYYIMNTELTTFKVNMKVSLAKPIPKSKQTKRVSLSTKREYREEKKIRSQWKSDRLQKIVHLLTEATKQSLKKKGMPCPPWLKAEYVKAKWLSTYTCITPVLMPVVSNSGSKTSNACKALTEETSEDSCEELMGLVFGESSPLEKNNIKSASTSLSVCGEDEKNVMVRQG